MARRWRPTSLGRSMGKADDWAVVLNDGHLQLREAGGVTKVHIAEVANPRQRRGVIWGATTFEIGGRRVTLRGMRNRDAKDLARAIRAAIGAHQELLTVALLGSEFELRMAEVQAWATAFRGAIPAQFASKGWLTRSFRDGWISARPDGNLSALLADPRLADHRQAQSALAWDAVEFWYADLRGYVAALNEHHTTSQAIESKDFFDRVERSPLTEEQIRAVVCFENRVQVIASAGSGKTSTMVAKAGYALHRGLVAPEKIVLLAFNTDAAKELEQRIRERLIPLGLDGALVVAKTFHALGLEIIGQATGRKPSLATWLNDGADHEKLMQIVDKLRDSNPGFRLQWDFFRLVLSRELPEFGRETQDPVDWDPASRAAGFRTLQGEVVKSQGERLIADWLFYNGVSYVYERPYEHETVDATHVQYHPDFYYPDIDAYHEHFALDRHGNPPPEFDGYLDGVIWKREVHRKFGTTLLETTMSELWDGAAFDRLASQLSERGIDLVPNPDRQVLGQQPLRNEQLIRTFRSFLIHAKSNRLDGGALRERARAGSGTPSHFRQAVFLSLFESIRAAWEQELAAAEAIDFEDMLMLAADHLEAGHWDPGYELVMVDEMQDASHARARLAAALSNAPDRVLFAVGDDWQSINGFAGADLSVMTDFARWFGEGETLKLERTFRSPQSICTVSSSFVLKNPRQLSKHVVSCAPEHTPSISAFAVSTPEQYAPVLQKHLEMLAAGIRKGTIRAGSQGKVSVLVLARYRQVLKELAARDSSRAGKPNGWDLLDVRFNTIHGSKGLEADYVIIPGMTKGSYGFPSTIVDDPVLRLAMPHEDAFPQAEERRLFYVALTRAKRAVLLLTVTGKESPFLTELILDHKITVNNVGGPAAAPVPCPKCGKGTLVSRTGPFSTFLGCSSFPSCRHTQKGAPQR